MNRKIVGTIVLVGLLSAGVGLAVGLLVGGGGPSTSPQPTLGRAMPAGTSVPDLRGLSLRQAVQVLSTLGLGVGTLSARRNGWEQGTVLSQGARPGSFIARGQHVSLVVSAGSKPQVLSVGGTTQATIGGTCDTVWPTPTTVCVGGPLLAPLEHG